MQNLSLCFKNFCASSETLILARALFINDNVVVEWASRLGNDCSKSNLCGRFLGPSRYSLNLLIRFER